MFQKLVSHNEDLRKLVDRGYAVAFDSNCLIVKDVPYLNSKKELKIGTLVTKLVFKDDCRATQHNHQVFFAGSTPHGLDGNPIPNLGERATSLALSSSCQDVLVEREFSNKPRDGAFKDFFHKIESYVSIISGPAIAAFNDATPLTFRCATEDVAVDSVFKIHDTMTTLAEISDLSDRLKNQVVAVIGLGGTGSFLLDLLIRTTVKEIRGVDHDLYYVHNVFRSPGAFRPEELNTKKSEVYRARYENFRSGLVFKDLAITEASEEELNGVTFAFVCVDSGSSRSAIIDLLLKKGIPFVDCGMGLNRKQGKLKGSLRATYFSKEEGHSVKAENLVPLVDHPGDEYKNNVQLGELNALNACLAIIKFKQVLGFYYEESDICHAIFEIGDLGIRTKDR